MGGVGVADGEEGEAALGVVEEGAPRHKRPVARHAPVARRPRHGGGGGCGAERVGGGG